jgi:hypothetical protein
VAVAFREIVELITTLDEAGIEKAVDQARTSFASLHIGQTVKFSFDGGSTFAVVRVESITSTDSADEVMFEILSVSGAGFEILAPQTSQIM